MQPRFSEEVWTKVRALVEGGMPMSKVEHLSGMPTKQAQSKRAQKEGWVVKTPTEMVDAGTNEQRTVDDMFSPVNREYRGKYCQEVIDRVLEILVVGGTWDQCAAAAGISDQTLRNWRKTYPEFDQECQAARLRHTGRAVMTIHRLSEYDLNAAKLVVERDPQTRDHYAPRSAPLVAIQQNFHNPLARVSTGVIRDPLVQVAEEADE